MPMSSVPWKEKPAIKNTPSMVKKLPGKPPPKNGASPTVKLVKPTYSPPNRPKIVSTPTPRKTMTVTTLMADSQNSPSPKARADRALSVVSSARNSAAQIHEGTPGSQ